MQKLQNDLINNVRISANTIWNAARYLLDVANELDEWQKENENEKKVSKPEIFPSPCGPCMSLLDYYTTVKSEVGDPIFALSQFNRDKLYYHKRQIDGMTIYKDLETTLLGALMIDSSNFGDVSKIVCAYDFKSELNREIFSVMTKLHENGKPIDSLNIKEDLELKGMMNLEKHIYIFNIAFNVHEQSIKHIISFANIINLENIVTYSANITPLNIMPESTEHGASCPSLQSETTETDYEGMLIAGLMLSSFSSNRSNFKLVSGVIHPNSFENEMNAWLFVSIQGMHDDNKLVNSGYIKSECSSFVSLYIDQLTELYYQKCSNINSSDMTSLAKIVKAKSDLREATDAITI